MATLKAGAQAPDFTLKDQEGKEIQLSKILEQKHVVLYFYPKDETPGCTKEACGFRDNYEDFKDAGAEVIGISGDSISSHQKFASKQRLPFILLSDQNLKVHKQYGIPTGLFWAMRGRVTFLIDQSGRIRNVFSSRLNIDKHINEALTQLKALPA